MKGNIEITNEPTKKIKVPFVTFFQKNNKEAAKSENIIKRNGKETLM